MKTAIPSFLSATGYAFLFAADGASAQRHLLRFLSDVDAEETAVRDEAIEVNFSSMSMAAEAMYMGKSGGSKSSRMSGKAGKRKTLNVCDMDDTIFFNSKYSEMVDLMSNGAEAIAIEITKDEVAARTAYVAGTRTEAEDIYVDFMGGIASPDFSALLTMNRRQVNVTEPLITLPYRDLNAFIRGFSYCPRPDCFAPGFYAILPFEGKFLNAIGGGSGYSYCHEDGTATTTINTIDIFVFVSVSYDNDSDGNFDNESTVSKVVVTWEKDEDGDWYLIKNMQLIADQLGYTSFGDY